MKSRQKGLGALALVGLIAIAGIVAVAAVLAVSYISAFNRGNELENGIKATYTNNQNVLTSYSQKVMEAAQVPEMMREDLIKVAKAAMEGRYGEDGSKAVFQAISEQNPQVSEKLYTQLQQIITAGRDEFKTNQTVLIDKKRVYETALGTFWGGMWLRIAGYPKINLADYKVVITDAVEQTFKTGKEKGPIQLRPTTAP